MKRGVKVPEKISKLINQFKLPRSIAVRLFNRIG